MKKLKFLTTISRVLTLISAILLLTITALYGQSGNFYGTNLHWALSGTSPNKTLTISGYGAMPNNSMTANWDCFGTYNFECYSNDISTIIIGDSVTSIGNWAFRYLWIDATMSHRTYHNVTSITIGKSVTSIGDYAFVGCIAITEITIPSSVTSIGNGAFRHNYYTPGNYAPLTKITVLPLIPPITSSNDPFYGVPKNTPIFVSDCASLLNYQSTPYWQSFTNYKTLPPIITAVTPHPNNNAILIEWENTNDTHYWIYCENTLYAQTSTNFYYHTNPTHNVEYCYKVLGQTNSCLTVYSDTMCATAELLQNTISGSVSPFTYLDPLPITTITHSNGSTQTNANGEYSFAIPHNESTTITPTANGYKFVPTSITLNNVQYPISSQNFTAVLSITDIIGVPTSIVAQTPLPLHTIDIIPIPKILHIVWSIKSVGTTGAYLSGNEYNRILNTTNSGTLILTATIENGITIGEDFIKDFTITVTTPHIAVTDITNVPNAATVNVPLTLSGTVIPSNATNKTIIWTMKNSGSTNATINVNTFTAPNIGTAIITATIENGIAIGQNFTKDFNIVVNSNFVAVTDITNVPNTATVNVPLTLNGTVVPSNATNKTINWTVKNSGTTNATINGNTFTATSVGTAIITATIQNGIAIGQNFTKDFNIVVNSNFVAVTDITNVPTPTIEGIPLTLSGTVMPSNATNQTIEWAIKNGGTTNATLLDNILNTTAVGTVIVTATIQNGTAIGTPFNKDFNIKVDPNVGIDAYKTAKILIYPNPTVDYVRINMELKTPYTVALYDIMGKKMNATIEYSTNEITVNIAHLPIGIYILRIDNETVKIIKE